MAETYAESSVKRRETAKTIGIRIGLVLGVILMFLISSFHPLLFILLILTIAGTIYIFPLLKIEYEYIYCDGQLDFDRVMGNSKRKRVLRIDFENVEMVAPLNSEALRSFENKEGMIIKDYSSLNNNSKCYAIIVTQNSKWIKIIFEPSIKILECMKQKSPRKVVL